MNTATVDHSLWALEVGRDEFTDGAYDVQRLNQEIAALQAERRRLVEQDKQKGDTQNVQR